MSKAKPKKKTGKGRRSAACRSCGGAIRRHPIQVYDPALSVSVVILGGFLTFYLVGFLLIPLGLWLWSRKRVVPSCVVCGVPSG